MNTDRFKFRVWDVLKRKYCNDEIAICQDGMAYIGDCMLEREYWIIEQCTGMKDKKGKLIYEGDVVSVYDPLTESHNKCVVEWGEWILGYYYKRINRDHIKCCISLPDGTDSEIIGNIHEKEGAK